MYRVIIVDDEPIIRKGLRETIEWESIGLEVSGEASNGKQALELIRTIRPHILITDIKMPEMGGIELIEQIKRENINIRIIILSGYSDFMFLKKAIHLGVESYLLKPIDNDELVDNLIEAVNNIEKEIAQITRSYQGQELLISSTLNRLVTQRIGADELREKLAFLGMNLEGRRFLCAICTVGKIIAGSFDKDEQMLLMAVHNICKELSEGVATTFIDSNRHVVFLFCSDQESALEDTVKTLMDNVVKTVEKTLGISLLVYVGTAVGAIENVSKSYSSAVSCLNYGVFFESGGIIWYDRIEQNSIQSEAEIKINYEVIKNLIQLGKKEELRTYIHDILLSVCCEGSVTVDYIRNLIMQISIKIMEIFHEINAVDSDEGDIIYYDYTALLSMYRMEDFFDWLFTLCDRLFFETGKMQRMGSVVAKKVINYIEQHYVEGPTLKQVAGELRVNTSYLGQIFKKETGKSYTDYVNHLRIKKAAEMLSKSNLKVYEVAEKVGFTDYRYFLKIFKKMTGITPKEIR